MSYDIRLVDPVSGETLETEEKHQMNGGTYCVGGTTELWLNITYNYANYYYAATDNDLRFAHEEVSAYYADGTIGPVVIKYGIRGIYGKSGIDSIPLIEDMISRIKEKYQKDGKWNDGEGPDDDYWKATAANAIRPLYQLIAMAKMRPDGVWNGD